VHKNIFVEVDKGKSKDGFFEELLKIFKNPNDKPIFAPELRL